MIEWFTKKSIFPSRRQHMDSSNLSSLQWKHEGSNYILHHFLNTLAPLAFQHPFSSLCLVCCNVNFSDELTVRGGEKMQLQTFREDDFTHMQHSCFLFVYWTGGYTQSVQEHAVKTNWLPVVRSVWDSQREWWEIDYHVLDMQAPERIFFNKRHTVGLNYV